MAAPAARNAAALTVSARSGTSTLETIGTVPCSCSGISAFRDVADAAGPRRETLNSAVAPPPRFTAPPLAWCFAKVAFCHGAFAAGKFPAVKFFCYVTRPSRS